MCVPSAPSIAVPGFLRAKLDNDDASSSSRHGIGAEGPLDRDTAGRGSIGFILGVYLPTTSSTTRSMFQYVPMIEDSIHVHAFPVVHFQVLLVGAPPTSCSPRRSHVRLLLKWSSRRQMIDAYDFSASFFRSALNSSQLANVLFLPLQPSPMRKAKRPRKSSCCVNVVPPACFVLGEMRN